MKKNVFMFLSASLIVLSFGYATLKEDKSQTKVDLTDPEGNEFKEFLLRVIPKEAAFRENYEASQLALSNVAEDLKGSITEQGDLTEDYILNSELRTETIKITKKAQRKLDEFREEVIAFQNSLNPNIRKIVRECLKIHEYGRVVLQLDYDFILSPQEFISSDEGINKLGEYRTLLQEQYEYVIELLKEIYETEPATKAEVPTKKIEFQYTQEELKAMDKWKNKTMNEMILDAHNGDAVALYMIGMMHLYGQGGFPINVEQADKYFATSALLGFAPAIDKIKGMYLEECPNVFLFFVYLNLTASFGHSEFTMAYHDQRKRIIEKCGISTVTEIEGIVAKKTMRIYETIKLIDESEDKMKSTFKLLLDDGIIGEDVGFGAEHWEKYFKMDGR